jgi:hypothetical protein
MGKMITQLGFIKILGEPYLETATADIIKAFGAGGLRITDDSDTLGIFVEDGGQVGIGIATPAEKLHVYAATGAVKIQLETPDHAAIIRMKGVSSSDWQFGIEQDFGGFIIRDQAGSKTGFLIVKGVQINQFYMEAGGMVGIFETVNAKMTRGLTINQGGYDDEILALKSSDVAHGNTDWTETDTFSYLSKDVAGGGLRIFGAVGAGEVTGVSIWAGGTDEDTTKSITSTAAMMLRGAIKGGGAGFGGMAPAANVIAMVNYTTALWIIDGAGDTWQSGGATFGGLVNAGASIDLQNGGTLQWDVDNYIYGNTASRISILTGGSETVRWTLAGMQLINDSANAKMTIGLTINQAGNDDEILAFKSSDVAHGITSYTETDTYGVIKKNAATTGGLLIRGHSEANAAFELTGVATTDDTSQTTGGYAPMAVGSRKKSGTSAGALPSGANVFVVRNHATTEFIIDADGNYHYNGADGGAFDDYEDAQLVRAFSLATSKDVIKTQWDEAVKYNEASLVEAGILGDTVANGGLVNGAQLQRLHNGAIWQLYQKIETQALQIENLESKLKLLEN